MRKLVLVREATPLIVVAAFLVAATLASGFSNATGSQSAPADAIKRFNRQTLQTVRGVTIHQVFDPVSRTVSASANGRPLKDGVYKIVNGGSIRVKGGIIVWDAFGVISKLNSGDYQALGMMGA
jgi:hypothetical protein